MSKTYIITDTHFNGNVYNNPNYTQTIFNYWSTIVGPDDTIIHGGDVCSGSWNKVSEQIASMPGKKILVRGNHDGAKDEKYLEAFDEVYSTYVDTENDVVYSHYPVDAEIYNCKYNIFGHFHKYPQNMKDSLVRRYKTFFDFNRNFTFCIVDWEYKPVEVQVFLKKCIDHAKFCV